MSRYLVLFASENLLNLSPAKINMNIFDASLFVRPILDNRDKKLSYLNKGWFIEVHLDEKNIDKAIKKGFEITEFFLSICCMETGFHIHTSKLILVYDITPNIEKRSFRQYFYNVPSNVLNSKIDYKNLSFHTQAICTYNTKYRSRVYRAMRWFRKGISSSDTIDQFLFFWHGLESLNSALAETYNVKKSLKKTIKRECKLCHKTYEDEITVKGGIEALYDDMNMHENDRKEINDIRMGISHGFDDIYPLSRKAYVILPVIARTLHYGIIRVIGVYYNENIWDNLGGVAPTKINEFIALNVIILERDISKIGIDDYYPHFLLNIDEDQISPQSFIGCDGKTIDFFTSGRNVKLHIEELK